VAPDGGTGKAAFAKPKASFKAITLATASAGPVSFRPKLNKTAKKHLKKKHKLKLSLVATYTPEGGGETTSQASTVTLVTKQNRAG
jgi:hypothetical protein